MAASICFEDLKITLKKRNITEYDLYIGAGRDHRLGNIFVNESYTKVKTYYTSPKQDQETYGITLVELAVPLELGSKNNLYPCCLLDFYVGGFGKFQFAGYGRTKMIPSPWTDYIRKDTVGEEDENLLMINNLERVECEKRLICARTTNSTAVCHLDQGGGLLHAFCGKLYVVGILADSSRTNKQFCMSGSTAKYAPVYEDLDWIDDIVEDDRCFTSNPMEYTLLFLFLILISACCFFASLVIYSMSAFFIQKNSAPVESRKAEEPQRMAPDDHP